MRLLRIIITMYTISQTSSKEPEESKPWRIQMNIPKMIMNLAEVTGLVDKRSIRSLGIEDMKHNTMTIEVKPPNFNNIFSSLTQYQRAGPDQDSGTTETTETTTDANEETIDLLSGHEGKKKKKKDNDKHSNKKKKKESESGERRFFFQLRHSNPKYRRSLNKRQINSHYRRRNSRVRRSIEKYRSRRAPPEYYVELAPGSFKSEQVTYKPGEFKNRLMNLMRFKEKRDKRVKIEQERLAALEAEESTGNQTTTVAP